MSKKKETIIFEGLGLIEGHFSGVGQYILGILRGMDTIIDSSICEQKDYHRVKVIVPYDSIARFKSFGFKNIEYVIAPFGFRLMGQLWIKNKLPPIDLLFGKGFYIFPRFVSMPLLFNKSSVIIYDISYELYPEYSDERNAKFLSASVSKSISKSNSIITISDNAKKEIVEFYGVNNKDITVAKPATDFNLMYRRSSEEINKIKDFYGINGEYIVALSNLEPRKNLDMLVDSYCNLPKELLDKYSLLLVGINGWKTDKLFDKILRQVKKGYKIIRPSGYVHDQHKAAILSGASLLVYPSHYEGFGMPPLEALACGTPVVTSDNSSLPEVVGELGIMVNSHDKDALTHAIISALKDKVKTKNIIKSGPKRARMFSWIESAQLIIDMVESKS